MHQEKPDKYLSKMLKRNLRDILGGRCQVNFIEDMKMRLVFETFWKLVYVQLKMSHCYKAGLQHFCQNLGKSERERLKLRREKKG